jgi:hypothetical protein
VKITIGILLLVILIQFVRSRKRDKISKENDKINAGVISDFKKIVEKLLPANPCMTFSPKTELHCMKPSSYIYAGLPLCADCAEKFIANGANPPPTKFDFK